MCPESSKLAVVNLWKGSQYSRTFKRASGNWCFHGTGAPAFSSGEQQSYLTTSWSPGLQQRRAATPWLRWTRSGWSIALECFYLLYLRERFRSQLENVQTRIGSLVSILEASWQVEVSKDDNGELRLLRAIQGHSGGVIMSTRLTNYVMILHKCIYLTRGSSTISILHSWNWISGRSRQKQKEDRESSLLLLILKTAMRMRQILLQISRKTRKESNKFIGDLNKMQCTGLICPQHKMLVLDFARGPILIACLGKSRKICKAWGSDPITSRSRTWPKEEKEQYIDLRADGILNDETYKDEQYMHSKTSSETSDYEFFEKTTHQRTTFLRWRKFLKQGTVSYIQIFNGRDKYNVNVASRTLSLNFKYVHAEDNRTCRNKCSPASDKNLSNSLQMFSWHSKAREKPGTVFSQWHKNLYFAKEFSRRIHERESSCRFLTAPQNDEVFQASWRQIHFTRPSSHALCTLDHVHTHCMRQDESHHVSFCALHSIFMLSWCFWSSVGCFLAQSFSWFSSLFTSSLPHSTCSLPGTPSSMSTPPRVKT